MCSMSHASTQHVLPSCCIPWAPLYETVSRVIHTVRSNFSQRCGITAFLFISAGRSRARDQSS